MFDTIEERKRAFDFGDPWYAYPWPSGSIGADERAHVWGSFFGVGREISRSPFYIGDHVARTMAILIEQFKPATRLKALITNVVDQLQVCEDVADDILIMREIRYAQGIQLDGIGEIVGQARNGLSDDLYRETIYDRIFINISSGVPEIILTVLKTLTQANQVRMIEMFPAGFWLFTDGLVFPAELVKSIQAISAAAITDVHISCSRGETPFEFDADGSIPYDEGDGFSEYNYTEGGEPIGGKLCELI